ncbi:Cation/H(+) antiporter 28 [Hibiscus syriacus]|uniref:Cation/H(+) antiporter 28 n=1 Tax=Hibiscus syriacus TaxID=106335 RepID=A0A6A2X9R1_HIBSY|nr:cation/H(+) antiporter 28-like [Hibiscus syriacus]KAE8672143.1 Cation/H(+) antiporter 28 [Hibiscus syriacus]
MSSKSRPIAPPPPPTNSTGQRQCLKYVANSMMSGSWKLVAIVATFILSKILHQLLKPLSQPQIISDILVGIFLASIQAIRDSFGDQSAVNMDNIVDFGMILYTFVLGLEMDPYVIFKSPARHTVVAYASLLSTFLLTSVLTPWLHYGTKETNMVVITITLSVTLAGTGSHILTRLITNLKIGKSDIGKIAIVAGVHSDMIAMVFLCVSFIFFPLMRISTAREMVKHVVKMVSALVIQTSVAAKISPLFLDWVNNENPEGKALKGPHLVLSMAFMAVICSCGAWFGYNPYLSSFMAGLFLPTEGRISKWAISKLNYFLNLLFYPLLFFWVGLKIDFTEFEGGQPETWERFFALLIILSVGKITGTVIGGIMVGFRWPELAAIGLLLMVKGHFNVYFAVHALRHGDIEMTTCISMVLVSFLSIVHAPFVVNHIIERARQLVPVQRMTLQCLDPTTELRIMLCVHEPHNLPSTINLMDISRGKPNPGLHVFVTDMVELTEKLAATLKQDQGTDNMVVTDESVISMREHITRAFQSYVDENGAGITLSRSHVLSTFNGMAKDLSSLAEDLMVSIILLPYHKRLSEDGSHDSGSPGFRYVNSKLLRRAPCSIGILVEKGSGFAEKITKSSQCKVAIIFIGGKDDREALSFAGQVAWHPGVELTVIRFLLDKNSENMPRRLINLTNIAEEEAEMKLDDESFTEFYEKYVAGGTVAYMEKHLANSSETYTTLRSLKGQYMLIIVGQGGRVNSILTLGLNDWQECPELGSIGDVLSGSGFECESSVLIIQQHRLKGQIDGLNDDFSIM